MPSTDLAEWFPYVLAAEVPTPRTEIVQTDVDLSWLLDGETPARFDDFLDGLKAAGQAIGYPLFMRTGYGSGKHQYLDTCLVLAETDLGQHVASLVEWSFCVDFIGLPTSTWVLRELLPVEAPFTAYHGMPVAKERRYFIGDDGKVIGHHPYWPPQPVADGQPTLNGRALPEDEWGPLYDQISVEPDDEIAHLTEQTEKIGAVLPGSWSVDWLFSPGRGWVCIDLAHRATSFVWAEHPNAPAGPRPEPIMQHWTELGRKK